MERLEADIERISVETDADEQLLRFMVALDSLAPAPAPTPTPPLSDEAAGNGHPSGRLTGNGGVQVSCRELSTNVKVQQLPWEGNL